MGNELGQSSNFRIGNMKKLKQRKMQENGTIYSQERPFDNYKNTEIFGYKLDSDPEEREFYVSCPYCEKLEIDNGINREIVCSRCNKVFEPEDQVNTSGNSHVKKKSFFSFALKERKSPGNFLGRGPFYANGGVGELASLVLYVNKDTLLGQFYDDVKESISYNTVMKKILLPFFKIKRRIVTRGMILKIGELEFKVEGIYPEIIGVVTSKTFIRCNNYYTANTIIKRVLMITTSKYENFNKEELMKNIIMADISQLQITKGDIAKINNHEFYIRNCEPECGRITKDTQISIENKDILLISKIKIGVIQNNVPTFNSIEEQKSYEDYIAHEYFNPYFLSGIRKYIERGDSIKVEDLEFFVLNSYPESGYISPETLVRFKVGISKEKCLEKIRKADNQLALGLLSYNNRSAEQLRVAGIDELILRELLGNGLQTSFQRRLSFDDNELDMVSEEVLEQQRLEENIRTLPHFIADEKYIEQIKSNKDECMKKCVICMEEFQVKDELKTLPCFHIFHKKCINDWLILYMNCPVCKITISPEKQNVSEGYNFDIQVE